MTEHIEKETEVVTEEVAIEAPKEGIVLYCDGSCRNGNPGFIGWGYHGYHYKDTLPKKGAGNLTHLLTTGGYIPKSEKGTKNEVTPVKYFDGFGSTHLLASNNTAEIKAADSAITVALEHPVSSIHLKTDSEYVRKGILEWSPHWLRNNWIRSDGTVVPNAVHWKGLISNLDKLKEQGTTFTIEWVKGHNNNLGNEAADKLATVGSLNSVQGNYVNTLIKTEPEGYWKKETDIHPFFFNKRMYFNTLASSHFKGTYYLGDHGTDDALLGTRTSDGAYSVVELSTPEPVLELIRQYQTEMTGDMDRMIMVRLDKAFNSTVYNEIENYGKQAMIRLNLNTIDLFALDKEPLTKELNPPRLAYRAIQCLSSLKVILDAYREGKLDNYRLTDITKTFYEEETVIKKKVSTTVNKLKSIYAVGFDILKTEAAFPKGLDSVTFPINITMGLDIATRNTLKRLEALDPKISIITWTETEGVYRYATVIEAKGDYCISSGMYSNTIFKSL